MLLKQFYQFFSNDIGIDLGTANTLVYVRDHGIVINEPSVVAVNQKTGQVVAVGAQAKAMIGRTPSHVIAIRPLIDGVISNFEVTEEMLAYLINKANKISKKTVRPRVVVGVPSGITSVEMRAVYDATKNAGAREVHIVEEPMAAAIGSKLLVKDPVGNMIIDIGGGTTDIAVISLGGIVCSKNLHIAGDRLNNDIISFVRDEFHLLIGERTAESAKIAIGSVKKGAVMQSVIRGRDLVSGLPREISVSDSDIREAMSVSITSLVDSVKEVIETTPPEVISDVMSRGIILVGGGALLRGLDELLAQTLHVPVYVANDPLTAVVRGTGIILESMDTFSEVLIQQETDRPPR